MKWTQAIIDKKLREIQDSMPDIYKFEQAPKTPTMAKVVDKAIEMFPEKREALQRLKNLGIFSQTEVRISEESRKEADRIMEAKILEAQRKGELPHPSQSPFMKKMYGRKRNR